MKCLENVERIRAPSPEVFWNEFVVPRRPVIITDLLDDDPIRRTDTKEKALRQMGGVHLTIRREYVNEILETTSDCKVTLHRDDEAPLPMRQYFNLVEQDRHTDLKCTEQFVPRSLRSLYRIPKYCQEHPHGRDMLNYLFVGNKGNRAALHYDGDFRHVLVYQAFGTKRFTIFPAETCETFDPVVNFSALLLQHYPEEEKLALVRELGGWDTTVQPGETIYLPMMVFHYVDYLDDTMSLTFRFARNRYHRFFDRYFSINRYMQNIGATMLTQELVEGKYRPFYSRMVRGLFRGEDMNRIMREVYAMICDARLRPVIPIPSQYRKLFPEECTNLAPPNLRFSLDTMPSYLKPFLSAS